MRRAARTDQNQIQIVASLRKAGCSVHQQWRGQVAIITSIQEALEHLKRCD